jgi:hypothetical protein
VTLPPPQRGDVIRYSYLWADENAKGRDEGRKDRPAVVLALSVMQARGRTRVMVLAVTHSPPRDDTDAVPLSAETRKVVGLGDDPAWVVTTEANSFVWPGPDVRPVPNRRPRVVVYGRLPMTVLRAVAASFLANRERQRARLVNRTE